MENKTINQTTTTSLTTLNNNDSMTTTRINDNIVMMKIKKEQERIDHEDAMTRCSRYGWSISNSTIPRRLFFGAMVADESWQLLQIHSTEVYNLFHVVALVESNTTHMATPRQFRFASSQQNNNNFQRLKAMWGPQTNLIVDKWIPILKEEEDARGMIRETMQRNAILSLWKQMGMLPHDVGIMADLDEVVSRDFLWAVKICHVPAFHQLSSSCQQPKLMPQTITFEAAPDCISRKYWYHPDFVMGHCIEGIGDQTERMVPLRQYRRRYGNRAVGHGWKGPNDYNPHIHQQHHYNINNTSMALQQRYPLLNGADMRMLLAHYGEQANHVIAEANDKKKRGIYGVAYHLHNFFDTLRQFRYKYNTYGHGDSNALKKRLSDLGPAPDIMVRCAKGIRNTRGHKVRFEGGGHEGPKPIYFIANHSYVQTRWNQLQEMVRQDEEIYGVNEYPR